ncbi:MAG TPA: hypothetical protein VEW47_04110 [Candidatus Dormibacteraeota bacterium]|nr:hypothetical protein [Candidatus Dormibacteraeota bacterium]
MGRPKKETQGSRFRIIYRTVITLRNGKKLYASSYGLKAWRLRVRVAA